MASIRRLKKDIDCLTFAVVDDSLNCLAVGKSMDDISEIVQHIIDSRNDLRQRVNAGKQVAKADRKGYYRTIGNGFDCFCRRCIYKIKRFGKAGLSCS